VLVGDQPDPPPSRIDQRDRLTTGDDVEQVRSSIEPLLQETADDETRFVDVKRLGMGELVWNHLSELSIDDSSVDPRADRDGRPHPGHGRQA
jgi:hypothetical protein